MDYTEDHNYSVEFHIDDDYNSSSCFNATTAFCMVSIHTSPSTGRLQADTGWSTVPGTPSLVCRQANTYSVVLPNSYFTPPIGYELLARGESILCNQGTNSNNTVINDFLFHSIARVSASSLAPIVKPPSTRSPFNRHLFLYQEALNFQPAPVLQMAFTVVATTLAQPPTPAFSLLWTTIAWLYMWHHTNHKALGHLPIC